MARALNDEEIEALLPLTNEMLRHHATYAKAFGTALFYTGQAIQVAVPVGVILNALVILAIVKRMRSQNSQNQSNKMAFLRFSLCLSFSDFLMCMIFTFYSGFDYQNVWRPRLHLISTFTQSNLNPNNTPPTGSSAIVFPDNVRQGNMSGGNTDVDLPLPRTTTVSMFGQDNQSINERIENTFQDIDIINESGLPLDHKRHDSHENESPTNYSNTDISNNNTDFSRPLADKSNTGISNASTYFSRPLSFVTNTPFNFKFQFDDMISINDFVTPDKTEVSLDSKILSSVFVLPITASSLSMTGSAIVVMIKIVWPFYNVSKKATIIAILMIWLVSLSVSVFSFMYMFNDNTGIMREKMDKVQVYLFTFTCLTVVLIASIYLIVVVVAFNMCSRSIVARKRKKSKAIITVSIIIGSYFICYIPFLFYYIGTNRYANLPIALTVAGTVVPLFFVINTCINPIVYSFRVLDIKQFITNIVNKFSC